MFFRSPIKLLKQGKSAINWIFSVNNKNDVFFPVSQEKLDTFYIDESSQIIRIQKQLLSSQKNISFNYRIPRVFVAVKDVNWEKEGLVDGWQGLADVIHYDWGEKYNQEAKDWHDVGKIQFNKEILELVKKNHIEKKIDIFFSYLSGRWIYPDTIKQISDLGIITINISLDDTLYFWGYPEISGLSGVAEIAPNFDICITTQCSADVSKYIYVGANPLFLPPASNRVNFPLIMNSREIPISFIGQRYGVRSEIIEYLSSHGISIEVFGKGWSNGEISREKMNEIYSKSQINLGFGYIGSDYSHVGLKGRDFEVPIFGGLYLTTYSMDLANCFNLGEEIDCYTDKKNLLEKIQYYLNNPEICEKIGISGQKRCLSEHTWQKRYEKILSIINIIVGN